ncbi:unnamed protein product [Cylicocyclus nassatus]|uniref:Choline O-acetyltransferase n=1 Tax=Cylicocyclus nassatus TaxID=53992 RepID=A0AA36M9E0_CYLNA|nr:unnamed protein product [Cylicocyclus nassatus]
MGIDTHLFVLFVLLRQSLENGEISQLPRLFTDPMWNELMRFPLETSQVTTSADISDCFVCYGARDEYACSYNLQKDTILFVPTSYKSNPRTDLTAFKDSLLKALFDMRALLTD